MKLRAIRYRLTNGWHLLSIAVLVAWLAVGAAPPPVVQGIAEPSGEPTAAAEGSGLAPGQPLAGLLNPDGTLNLATGFRGSVDAHGWRMVSQPEEPPRFMPLAGEDDRWADIFAPPGVNDLVLALVVDGGNVYAGGDFTTAGGLGANRVAKWNGSSWSALGSGMNDPVWALAVDGGNLYAGGAFTTAGGKPSSYIGKWRISSKVYIPLVIKAYTGGW